jgi:3-hydroxyisobutyrate dehydrogenase-like beta-hydroxyacid dehydrogenase
MTKISILGCGWLGFPLAKALLNNGFSVKVQLPQQIKLLLENAGIQAFQVVLDSESVAGPIQSC